ncbi:MAG: cpdB2 [Bacilli bacterium]|nr:cpdB2 [Bacilli bacterium]
MKQNKHYLFASVAVSVLLSFTIPGAVVLADGTTASFQPADLVGSSYEMSNHPLPETTFTLISDTHEHGNFGDQKSPENIANKFGIVNQIKAKFPNSLYVGNGDDMGTSVFTSTSRGQNMVDAFNAGKLDTDTFGNHDFDMGPDRLEQLIKESNFTWVSANVIDKRTNDVFGKADGAQRFIIKKVNGVNVGITGLTEEDAAQLTSMGDNVAVLNPIEAMKTIIPQMKAAGADIIVVASHLASPDARILAQNVDGIDVLVGDHAAQDFDTPEKINNTLLWFIGDNFKHVGQINFYIKNGKIQDFNFHKFTLQSDAAKDGSTADTAVKAVMDQYYQQLSQDLSTVIGTTQTPLDENEGLVRSRETAIGDFAADAMRSFTNSDVAFLNGGGIRANRVIPAGTLTKKDIMDSFPFTNFVVKLQVTGDQLYQALENGVSQVEKGAGRFPQVSGIAYSYNPKMPPGSRIGEVSVNGAKLDKTATYTLATLDYVQGGGDGYTMFKNSKVVLDANGGPLLSKLIIDAIQKANTIAPKEDGRIQVLDQLPSDYFVDIVNNSGVNAIMDLKRKGIVNGEDAQHFNPDQQITRAEFTAMIAKVLKLPLDQSVASSYQDVSQYDWCYSYISALTSTGIVHGNGDNSFDPNGILSSDQMKIILTNVLSYQGKKADVNKDILQPVKLTQSAESVSRANAAITLEQYLQLK